MSISENIKVVLLGEPGVGKTCIINRFSYDKYNEKTVSSISAQFITKNFKLEDINKEIKFEIWDTAGQEKFHSLAKIFYKDAKVICLVYDITLRESFEKMKSYWYEQEVLLNADGQPIFAVVGNKYDLYESSQVSNEEALEFAKSIRAIFQYTSAKQSSGINELFNNIGNKYFNPDFNLLEEENKERELYEKKKIDKESSKKEYNDRNSIRIDASSVKEVEKKKSCC
jgi:small GTP-binding protein